MADDALANGVQRIPSACPPALFWFASPLHRGGYAHVFFLSIAGRITFSRADSDTSGEVTIVAAFTRHHARLQHNTFHGICLVCVFFVIRCHLPLKVWSCFAIYQHIFDSA
jgi:hypothetical protein